MYNINYDIVYMPIGYVRDENYNVEYFTSHAYYSYDRAKKALTKMAKQMRNVIDKLYKNVDALPTDNGGKRFTEDGYTCGEIQLVPFTFNRVKGTPLVKTFSVCLSDILDTYNIEFSVRFITPKENDFESFDKLSYKLEHDENHLVRHILDYTDANIQVNEDSRYYSSDCVADEYGGSGTSHFNMKLYQITLDPKY